MIKSFANNETADLFHRAAPARLKHIPPDVIKVAQRKLDMINAAHKLQDLASPPGNRLEALHGNLAGYHSIRVNDQWRIVFKWRDDGAHEVLFTDYH